MYQLMDQGILGGNNKCTDHLKTASKICLRLVSVVILPCSPPMSGLNSTTSMLHSIFNSSNASLNPLKNQQAVSFLIPLGAMVPVEGISIGSIPSMSKLTWATSIFSSFNHLNTSLKSSSVFTTLMLFSLIKFYSQGSRSLIPQQIRFYSGRVFSLFTHSKVLSTPQTKLRGIPWQFLVIDISQVLISAWASTHTHPTFFPSYLGLFTTESTVLIASEWSPPQKMQGAGCLEIQRYMLWRLALMSRDSSTQNSTAVCPRSVSMYSASH